METQCKNRKLEIKLYHKFCVEFLKFMGLFGSTMGFAFSEIKEKSDTLVGNVELFKKAGYVKDGDDASIYVQDFIKIEISKGLTMLNGGNGKKYL